MRISMLFLMAILLMPLSYALSVGVSPPNLSLELGSTEQIIIFNPNPHSVRYSLSSHSALQPAQDGGVIEAGNTTTVELRAYGPEGEYLLMVNLIGETSGLVPAVVLKAVVLPSEESFDHYNYLAISAVLLLILALRIIFYRS